MRRPWNIPDVPVYSLATYAGGRVNMNICTYVTPISMKPKQYAVAVYKNTQTLDNLLTGSGAVLQLLHRSQANLVPGLGKRSGRSLDKQNFLQRKKVLIEWNGHQVLTGAMAWIELKPIGQVDSGGDHLLYYFESVRYKTNRETSCLSLQHLIRNGWIL